MNCRSTQRRGAAQRQLPLRERFGHGGRREGAGRKPRGARAGVSHAVRPSVCPRHPLHVTLRVLPHVPNLRSRRVFRVIEAALSGALKRDDFRIVHFDVLGNHLHLIVEDDSTEALSRGMQGFSISVAKRVNKLFGRHGAVFADRYHARELKTPTEVRNAIAYVLLNHRSHEARAGVRVGRGAIDPFSSGACFDGWVEHPLAPEVPRVTSPPRTWLLAVGWRRRGLVSLSEIPALRE